MSISREEWFLGGICTGGLIIVGLKKPYIYSQEIMPPIPCQTILFMAWKTFIIQCVKLTHDDYSCFYYYLFFYVPNAT